VTSGVFGSCLIERIIVNRAERQRRKLVPADIDKLANSIARLGLIHPVVLTRDFVLVAGESRLEAVRQLGWTSVPFQFQDELDPRVLAAIELEENIKRQDITWQDQCRAIVAYQRLEPSWTQESIAEAIGLTQAFVSQNLSIAKYAETKPEIWDKKEFSEARGTVENYTKLVKQDAERAILNPIRATTINGVGDLGSPDKIITPLYDHINDSILNASFLDWSAAYSGEQFNLIHCDFPYGIESDKSGQGNQTFGDYVDSAKVYHELLDCFAENFDRIAAESCHVIFWFATNKYNEIFEFLQKLGLTVDPPPLVWVKSDNTGIAPDPRRRPRRVYEWAFLGWRGDRPIIRLKSNAVCLPTTAEMHKHEKPVAVLRHFLEMVVYEGTVMLDPTAGSGTALRAAEALGAKHVLGIEKDPEFCRRANAELEKFREGLPSRPVNGGEMLKGLALL
jgi:ParB/RepB/Spo0J family partition protein